MEEKTAPQSGSDRRQHERIRKDLKVRYSPLWNLSGEAREEEGAIVDISGGGLRFMTPHLVGKGTQLVLTMAFPGWISKPDEWRASDDMSDIGVLKVLGEVLRVETSTESADQYEIAVRFSGRIRL